MVTKNQPRAFTMLELAVTMIVVTVIAAFTLPQITSSVTLSQEQTAKSTINSVLDAVSSNYARRVASSDWVLISDGYDTGTGYNPIWGVPKPDIDAASLTARGLDANIAENGGPSTDNHTASVGATQYDRSWKVGVAVLTNTDGACWYAIKIMESPAGSSTEAYFVNDSPSITKPCTGAYAAGLQLPDQYTAWDEPQDITGLP